MKFFHKQDGYMLCVMRNGSCMFSEKVEDNYLSLKMFACKKTYFWLFNIWDCWYIIGLSKTNEIVNCSVEINSHYIL